MNYITHIRRTPKVKSCLYCKVYKRLKNSREYANGIEPTDQS